MSTIKPTIGRKVWLWLGQGDYDPNGVGAAFSVMDRAQAFDATVAFVHTDGTVNLGVLDHAGQPCSFARMRLYDPDPENCHGQHEFGYATWMPYQVGQAKAQAIGAAGPVT